MYIYIYIYIYMSIPIYIYLSICLYIYHIYISLSIYIIPWNWSSCTKLALSASWIHGLVAQSVRASEWNSVVVGSNPTQANFHSYFKQSFSGEYHTYIYTHTHIGVTTKLNFYQVSSSTNLCILRNAQKAVFWRNFPIFIKISKNNWSKMILNICSTCSKHSYTVFIVDMNHFSVIFILLQLMSAKISLSILIM